MEADAILGLVLLIASVAIVIYLTVWSKRTIDRIARSGSRSARRIIKELNSDN